MSCFSPDAQQQTYPGTQIENGAPNPGLFYGHPRLIEVIYVCMQQSAITRDETDNGEACLPR